MKVIMTILLAAAIAACASNPGLGTQVLTLRLLEQGQLDQQELLSTVEQLQLLIGDETIHPAALSAALGREGASMSTQLLIASLVRDVSLPDGRIDRERALAQLELIEEAARLHH